MEKSCYRNAKVGACCEFSQLNQGWMGYGVVSYQTTPYKKTDLKIVSREERIFSTFEQCYNDRVELAQRWVDQNL